MQAQLETAMYYYELVQERRANPQDDMISRLIAAEIPDESGTLRKLDDIEITSFASLLGGAGAETVTKLLGTAMVNFARFPEQWQKLLDDRSKIPAAVEELLRYEGPVQYNVRYSLKDAHLHGVTIPAGKPVFVIGAAANRDPRAFTDADKFDIDRDRTEAQNLGLGYGIHSCLGAALARMESAIALERLLDFMPRYEVQWDRSGTRTHAERRGLAQRPGEGAAMKIEVDFGLCEANAICMGIIPEVFQVDEQDYLHVLSDEVTPENEAQIRDAVRQCPRQAISIVD